MPVRLFFWRQAASIAVSRSIATYDPTAPYKPQDLKRESQSGTHMSKRLAQEPSEDWLKSHQKTGSRAIRRLAQEPVHSSLHCTQPKVLWCHRQHHGFKASTCHCWQPDPDSACCKRQDCSVGVSLPWKSAMWGTRYQDTGSVDQTLIANP